MVGIFITVAYKYTEKFERKKLKNRIEVQTLTITDKSLKPHFHKTAVSTRIYFPVRYDVFVKLNFEKSLNNKIPFSSVK